MQDKLPEAEKSPLCLILASSAKEKKVDTLNKKRLLYNTKYQGNKFWNDKPNRIV